MMQRTDYRSQIKLALPISYALLTGCLFYLAWPDDLKPHHVVGTLTATLSFAFWITARIQLGNAFSLAPQAKHLVTTVIYSKLRHPVYYFSITSFIGISLFIWQLWAILPLVLLSLLQWQRIKREEAVLYAAFGQEYIRYKQSTWL